MASHRYRDLYTAPSCSSCVVYFPVLPLVLGKGDGNFAVIDDDDDATKSCSAS
jgi:hypothetical protein